MKHLYEVVVVFDAGHTHIKTEVQCDVAPEYIEVGFACFLRADVMGAVAKLAFENIKEVLGLEITHYALIDVEYICEMEGKYNG